MGYADRLAKMTKSAKEQMADYTPGGFAAIPDGQYEMRVKTVLDETRKEPKRLQISWCFVVASVECEGRQVWDRTILEDNKVGLQIARGRIEDLGYTWPEDNMAALEGIVESITERCPLITVSARSKENDGGYTNTTIRIKEVAEPFEGEVETPAEETEAAPEPEPEATDDTQARMLSFCASMGIDGVSEENSVEEIVAALRDNEITFKPDELTDEDKALLTEVVAEDRIEKAKPAPALVKKSISMTKKPTAGKAVSGPAKGGAGKPLRVRGASSRIGAS